MLKKIAEANTAFDMFGGADSVAVALSGGADSMALLNALIKLKSELGIKKITAAHFNHLIRGDEAFRDQNFVVEQCKKLGVELKIGSADVPEFAQKNGLGTELAARKLRYEFFETLETDVIATAHTASDNIETVLFNLTRGTALSGICGIPPKRDRFVRPLIFCTRYDIELFCKENAIPFVTDSTNLCDDYSRNKIRHNVIPVLKSLNLSAENAVSRMTASLREDEDFINSEVQKKYDKLYLDGNLSLKGFKELHPAVAKRIIAKFCSLHNIEVDFFHINAVYGICLSGGKTSLSNNQTALAQNEILKICSENAKKVTFEVKIEQKNNDLFQDNKKIHNLLLKNILDCDKIVGELVLRNRSAGDTIRLKNKNCTKTLKKLFCEYKIPLEERSVLPLLCDDEGVVWIHTIGVAERCAADENSKRIYSINVKKSY